MYPNEDDPRGLEWSVDHLGRIIDSEERVIPIDVRDDPEAYYSLAQYVCMVHNICLDKLREETRRTG